MDKNKKLAINKQVAKMKNCKIPFNSDLSQNDEIDQIKKLVEVNK